MPKNIFRNREDYLGQKAAFKEGNLLPTRKEAVDALDRDAVKAAGGDRYATDSYSNLVGRMTDKARVEMDAQRKAAERAMDRAAKPPSFQRGGTMRKAGVARLHAGEKVAKRGKGRGGCR